MNERHVRRTILLGITALVLSGCVAFDNTARFLAGRPLDEEKLQNAFSTESELQLTWANGVSGTMTFAPDSTVTLAADGQEIAGTWRTAERIQLCTSFDEGADRCFFVFKRSKGRVKLYNAPDGSLHASGTGLS